MAKVNFTSFYLGPYAVYTSPTGMADVNTLTPYLGGTLHEGDYCDLSAAEASQYNLNYGTNLYPGRYRFVKLSTAATYSNIGFGTPVGVAAGTTVAQVVISAAGSGYTNGTFICSSTTSGGTQKATASVVVSGGAIISVQLLNPGAGFTSVPTFSLSELSGGSAGSILAQMVITPNVVTSFDSSAVSLSEVRGVSLCTVTAAQVTAGAWIVIQESGIAPVKVTTATNTAAGCAMAATTGAAVTTTTAATAIPVGFFGYTIDLAAASTVIRGILRVPPYQG